MKILLVYYSKTGVTKRVALTLSEKLKAVTEELIDKKKRTGILGWLKGGSDGMRKIPTEIEKLKNDPAGFDIVLVGGPLWGFNSVAPAARTYLADNIGKIKKTAFFMTRGGGKPSTAALEDLKKIAGKKFAGSTLDIRQNNVSSPEAAEQIARFAEEIKKLRK